MEKTRLDPLDELVEYSLLYDFYGPLLKEKHREIFEDYVLNNLSLGEIARERNITRQGVYDALKRCRMALREYEDKMHLVDKFEVIREKLHTIEQIAREDAASQSERIEELTKEIYDVI